MPAPWRMHRPMCSGAPSACVFAAVAMLVACVAHVPEEGQSDLRCRDDSECTAPQRHPVDGARYAVLGLPHPVRSWRGTVSGTHLPRGTVLLHRE